MENQVISAGPVKPGLGSLQSGQSTIKNGASTDARPTSTKVAGVPRNKLLASLPQDELDAIMPDLRPVRLPVGEVLHEVGGSARACFVHSGLVSLVLTSQQGVELEVGVVGREGLVGVDAVLSGGPAVTRAVVQIAGCGWLINPRTLLFRFKQGGALQDYLLQYMQALLTQTCQTALCNRLHMVDQRLARWLLTARHVVQSDDLELTQEFIAHMLGTRRAGVTVAANDLRQSGLIRYSRGHITIIDPIGLKARACECYPSLREQLCRLYKRRPQQQ